MSPGIVHEGPERIQSPAFLKGFTGRDSVKSMVLRASDVAKMTGDEVQSVTINGGPTGGHFNLTYNGRRIAGGGTSDSVEETANIAYNATGADVQAALEALAEINPGDVAVTGGAGGPYQVEFEGNLGSQEMNLLTADSSGLTGGTTPSVSVVRVTMGTFDVGRRRFHPGTILTLCPDDDTKVRKYTAATGENAGTIVGIGGRNSIDLFSGGPESDVDVPVYHFGAHFDSRFIIDYALHAADLGNAAALKTCKFD